MDASELTSEQRWMVLQIRNQSDHATFEIEVYRQLKQLGIVYTDADGSDRLSELGESIGRQLAEQEGAATDGDR